jgi:hypothetical protein
VGKGPTGSKDEGRQIVRITFKELDGSAPDTEQESTSITPEDEAKALEFTRKMAESILTVNGLEICYDSKTVFAFRDWLYQENLAAAPELDELVKRSIDWIVEQREVEVKAGILYSSGLCGHYSRAQVAKIEADPTNEALYGYVISKEDRQKAIAKSKEYFAYLDKFGHINEELNRPKGPPSPIPPIEKPQVWTDLDKPAVSYSSPVANIGGSIHDDKPAAITNPDPEPVWTEQGWKYVNTPKSGGISFVKT